MQVDAESLLIPLGRNFGVVQAQTAGITHEQSLIQPTVRGNCMNWVVGHMVEHRERMLRAVGQPTFWKPEEIERYKRESPPVLVNSDALPFEKILGDLAQQHQCLSTWLKAATLDDLAVVVPNIIEGLPDWTRAQWLHFLIWHETYHLGNLELLRQLAGTNDKVI